MLRIALLYKHIINEKLKNKTTTKKTHKQQQKKYKTRQKIGISRFTSANATLATPGSYQARWLR